MENNYSELLNSNRTPNLHQLEKYKPKGISKKDKAYYFRNPANRDSVDIGLGYDHENKLAYGYIAPDNRNRVIPFRRI